VYNPFLKCGGIPLLDGVKKGRDEPGLSES